MQRLLKSFKLTKFSFLDVTIILLSKNMLKREKKKNNQNIQGDYQ